MKTKVVFLADDEGTEWTRTKSRCGCSKRHRTLHPVFVVDIIECVRCGATWPLHSDRFETYQTDDYTFEVIRECLRYPSVFGLAK